MKKAVVSALFNSDSTTDIIGTFKQLPGWDYYLFTYSNNDQIYPNYNIIKLEKLYNSDVKMAKYVKWNTHKLLPDYDVIIWVDAFMSPSDRKLKEIETVVDKVITSTVPLALLVHPQSKNAYDEINACVNAKKINKEMANNVRAYLSDKRMRSNGTWWSCMLIKNNKSKVLQDMSDEIMWLLDNICYRDQVWMPYLFEKYSIQPISIPTSFFVNTGKVIQHKYA